MESTPAMTKPARISRAMITPIEAAAMPPMATCCPSSRAVMPYPRSGRVKSSSSFIAHPGADVQLAFISRYDLNSRKALR
jgi:hypothetical protein